MPAVDFLVYCAGVSAIIVSVGAAIRLGRRPPSPVSRQRPEQALVEPEQAVDMLAARMHAFQGTRYASPIVQRVLSHDAVPLRRPLRQDPETQVSPAPRSHKKEG